MSLSVLNHSSDSALIQQQPTPPLRSLFLFAEEAAQAAAKRLLVPGEFIILLVLFHLRPSLGRARLVPN